MKSVNDKFELKKERKLKVVICIGFAQLLFLSFAESAAVVAGVAKVPSKSSANRNSCPEIDLSKESFLPKLQAQGNRDWCFAFAAAATASSLAKQPLSMLDLAVHHNIREMQAEQSSSDRIKDVELVSYRDVQATEVLDFAGGSISEAVNLLYQRGVCSEEDLPSSNDNHLRLRAEVQGLSAKDLLKKIDRSCQKFNPINGYVNTFDLRDFKTKTSAPSIISKLLMRKLIPSLSLNGNMIKKHLGKTSTSIDIMGSRSQHAVAIVGQEEIKGQCYFHLRDSYSGRVLQISREEVLANSSQIVIPYRKKSNPTEVQKDFLELPLFRGKKNSGVN